MWFSLIQLQTTVKNVAFCSFYWHKQSRIYNVVIVNEHELELMLAPVCRCVFPGGAVCSTPRQRTVSWLSLWRHVIAALIWVEYSDVYVTVYVSHVIGVIDNARQLRSKTDFSAGTQLGATERRRYRAVARPFTALTLRLLARLQFINKN